MRCIVALIWLYFISMNQRAVSSLRAFTAVALPEAVKDELASMRRLITGRPRWVHRDDFHLTLRFIGDVNVDTTDEMERYERALSQIVVPPFRISLEGVGRFPKNVRRKARVLWVGVKVSPELLTLYEKVSDVLEQEGLQSRQSAGPDFSPHITLARLDGSVPVPEIQDFLDDHADYKSGTIPVDTITLYESKQNALGGTSCYSVLKEFPLLGKEFPTETMVCDTQ